MSWSAGVNSDEQPDDQSVPSIHIHRPVLTQQKLNEQLGRPNQPGPPKFREQACKLAIGTARFFAPECLKSKLKRKCPVESAVVRGDLDGANDAIPRDDRKTQSVSPHPCMHYAHTFGTWFISFFPFIGILRKYDVKNWLLNDMIAGLTVGIMHVPQGMAYAMLATLPPVYGLYTSFFPPLVYFVFGTSRHVSMGTIAVVSLLTGEFLDKVVKNESYPGTANQTDLIVSDQVQDTTALRVGYAAALSMTVGLSQIVMGLFRMGGVIRYLSGPMTSGFTFGVAIHVFTSQITTLLGVKILKPTGLFTVPRTYYEVLQAIQTANLVTIGLSAVCILIITVVKMWISPPVAKRIRVPIPIDLIIVVLATVTSHYLELNNRYHVKVVGHVSKGIKAPVMPHLGKMDNAIGEIVLLAVISFSVNSSLVRIFAKKLNYKSDFNQELYAYGLSNIISSFFQAYPSAASLSRSSVQVSAGGKTQVATLFSSVLLVPA